MTKNLLLIFCLVLLMAACKTEESQVSADQKIQFQLPPTSSSGNTGGRVASASVTAASSVIVTIKDDDGTTVADRVTLSLYQFGNNFLTLPLTLKVTGKDYHLSEFMVADANNNIILATPKRGSALANLVNNPLDIDFTVISDQITTVVPEVLSVDASNSADEFGYGQFGFEPITTIQTVFSAFTKGVNNFELTTAHLKMEAVNDTITATPFWTNEVDLQAVANKIVVRQAPYYILTATKSGYQTWKHVMKLVDQTKVEILFKQGDGLDIYAVGYERTGPNSLSGVYWKNGQKTVLTHGLANGVFVSNGDVYVSGNDDEDHPVYWKNGQKIFMDQNNTGYTSKVFVKGNDVYAAGLVYPDLSKPAFWKNGNRVSISGTGNFPYVGTNDVTVDGNDVYVIGFESNNTTGSNSQVYPLIWKNNVVTRLPLPSPDYKNINTVSVIVKNGHVYVLGSATDPVTGYVKAIYWRDNEITIVEKPGNMVIPTGFAVQDDGTVHIITWFAYPNSALYFVNGIETVLDAEISSDESNLFSIATIGNDVLIGGYFNHKATYWLNGKRTTIDNDINTEIHSITAVSN